MPGPANNAVRKPRVLLLLFALISGFVPSTEALAVAPLCTPASGRVTDLLGQGLNGILVDTKSECESSPIFTDSEGRFWFDMQGHALSEEYVEFSGEGYISKSARILADTWRIPNEVQLPFALEVQASPYARKSGGSVVVGARTTAPSSTDVRVDVKRDSDLVASQLAYSYSEGMWNHFVGQFDHPIGDTTRYHLVSSCVVRSGFLGSCQEANASNQLLSEVGQTAYWIDDIPPTIQAISPPHLRNTILRKPSLSFSPSDAHSGLLYTSITLDGRLVSNASSWIPPSDLRLGEHSAEFRAEDRAGNVTTASTRFNIVSISGSSTSGAARPQTIDVNPDGVLVGAPTSVTFSNIEIVVEGYTVSMTSSPFRGAGDVRRDLPLTGLRVVFRNESPLSEVRNVGLQTMGFRAGVALLSPSAGDTVAYVPQAVRTIPSLRVEVPPGFNTSASTATIEMAPVPASTVYVGRADPLNGDLPPLGGDPLLVSVSTQSVIRIDESNGQVTGVSGPEGTVYVYTVTGNLRREILGPQDIGASPPEEDTSDSDKTFFSPPPVIKCDGGIQSPPKCVYQSGSVLYNRAYSFGLREAGFAGYANHWIYRDTANPVFMSWHQVGTVVDQVNACLSGVTARAEILKAETSTRQVIVDPGLGRSPWLGSAVFSTGGSSDPGNDQMLQSTPELSWEAVNSLSNVATYSRKASLQPVSPDNASPLPLTTSLTLSPKSGEHLFLPEKFILGTRYELDRQAVVRNALEIVSTNDWQFWVSQDAC